jgi:hypothetical protein
MEGDVTGGGPTSRATPFWTPPPPPLKAEWKGGSGIRLSTVDQGDLNPDRSRVARPIPDPPPPPSPLKAERQGGSGMKPQP